ncbi:MAG: hypothetical protein QOJ60_2956 [Actinomycetota bacterium]|nr:hypothetical protein [Actinomycetota bacterium]
MVPRAEFDSYYGRAILKRPTWKVPDVPAYLTLGGAAGASAVVAAGAELAGRPVLARAARRNAAIAALAGTGALVHDLGRPERFLHMLRVLKPTSPLSVGSWILAPFSALSAAAVASDVSGRLPRLGRLAGAGAAGLGPALATYTAVLFADTAVPAWHEAYPELPFIFAGSALASGAGAALVTTPAAECGPVRHTAALGAAIELAASRRVERRLGLVGEPYREPGRARSLLQAGKLLTAGGVATVLVGRRSRTLSAVGGLTLLAASFLTRLGIFEAGVASAEDPRYTVAPQRARLAERGAREGKPSDRPHGTAG